METFRRVRAIPTTYRGVRMRSKTEAAVAAVLDQVGIPWEYEPCHPGTDKPHIYWVPGVRGSGYLPDFRIWPERRNPWFVEVKPTGIYDERHTDPGDLRNAIDKLTRIRHHEPRATLVLWVADPRADDFGQLLIHVPGASGWVQKPALPWLCAAHRAFLRERPRRTWWRRLLGR